MTQTAGQNLPSYVRDFATLASALPEGPSGLRDVRAKAATTLLKQGLPSPKCESWKFTNLRNLPGLSLSPVPSLPIQAVQIPTELAPARIIFVDGRFRPDLSHLATGLGVRWQQGLDVPAEPDAHPLRLLNEAYATDGGVLTIEKTGTPLAVEFSFLHSGTEQLALHYRPHIRVAEGAEAVIIERFAGSGNYLVNNVMSIDLATGARLDHLRIQQDALQAHHLCLTEVKLADKAAYRHTALNLGAHLTRHEMALSLQGREAEADIKALQILDGQQHGDVTLTVAHDQPQTRSQSLHRAVLGGKAHGVFQGKIAVARDASGTDGKQHSQALLLSPYAAMDTKPELEIFTDDVKCAHGAAVGALDEGALFYLRARGIDAATARLMLIDAFLTETIGLIDHDLLRDHASRFVHDRLNQLIGA